MADPIHERPLRILLLVALILVFLGGAAASYVQTDGGRIEIRDVRFMGTDGTLMSGLLYIPDGVSAENPAPGVLAIHGYINSRETQDGFAIEFARRGYVVLALDQTGHGFSDPPAFANGFGGPDGLRYLRSLDIVDPDNIGLEGHSMGGWASLAAAAAYPDDYKAIVLEGSSTGAPFAAEGTPEWPRNLAVVFSEWDEFSQLMWGVDVPPQMVEGEKLKTLFGTDETVEIGRLYGSIEDGTARRLYMPRGTHPNDHISTEAIGYAIEWMQLNLEGGNDLPPSDQIWYWKEIGTFVQLIGFAIFLFAAGGLLLLSGFFKELRDPLPEARGATGIGRIIAIVLTVVIPALTFFWLQNQGSAWFPVSAFWPQQITTGIMVWAVGNGLISLVLFLVWHFTSNRNEGATNDNYGLTWAGRLEWNKILKSFLFAAWLVFLGYLLVAISDWLFKTDFRLWVVALKPMSRLHFQMFLAYLIPFTFFFLVISTVINGQLRWVHADGRPMSQGRSMLLNGIILALGIIILLIIQYVPLMSGQPLPLGEPLLTIVAYQFVPLLLLTGFILTYFFRKTGRVYAGAFICSLLVTWYIVAGQATHFPF